jgi:excinuclease UvrABC nuclease subunit
MNNEAANWRSVPFTRGVNDTVPERAGVYAILRTKRVHGLPLTVDPVYVGKSRNLRQRLRSHLNRATAHNDVVASLMNRETIEFWCILMPEGEVGEMEKAIIQGVKPMANKIRYGGAT